MVRGEMQYNIVSRFVKEIPPMIVNSKNVTDTRAAGVEKKQPSFSGFGGYEGSLSHGGGYMGSSKRYGRKHIGDAAITFVLMAFSVTTSEIPLNEAS